MKAWTVLVAKPIGFVLMTFDGNMYLKMKESILSPGVGGEEWDATDLLKFEIGQKECPQESKWEVRRDDAETITFEMIDKESKVDWSVPHKMSIDREELITAAKMFKLL